MISRMTAMAFRSLSHASEPALSTAEWGGFYESDRPTKNALERGGSTTPAKNSATRPTSTFSRRHLIE
jgi:hypothetical protein